MKQTILMVLATAVGAGGAVLLDPYLGIATYYLFAVLRPQFLWQWALPPEVRWSMIVAVATIVAAMLHGPADPAGKGRFSRAHVWLLAFGGWIGVSFLFATSRDVAGRWLLEYSKIFVMFALSAWYVTRIRRILLLLHLATASLCYIAWEVNLEYLRHGRLDIFHQGFGGLDNNGAALLLAMAVPMCLALWQSSPKWWRWIYLAFVPVLLHAILLTYSRGAVVALLLGVPVIWLRAVKKGATLAVLLSLCLIVPLLAGNEARERLRTLVSIADNPTSESRYQSWEAGIRMALDHPLVGVGIRNSELYSLRYGADIEGRAIHNQFLQIAADTGFVGLGLYLVALAALGLGLVRARRLARQREGTPALQILVVVYAVEGSLAIFLIGGVFLSLEVVELPYLLFLLGAQVLLLPGGVESREIVVNRLHGSRLGVDAEEARGASPAGLAHGTAKLR